MNDPKYEDLSYYVNFDESQDNDNLTLDSVNDDMSRRNDNKTDSDTYKDDNTTICSYQYSHTLIGE